MRTIARIAVRRLCPSLGFARMFLAALWSRSATYPHEGQTCVLTESDFSTNSPQFEQSCEVKCGATLYTLQPALSALRQRMLTN